MGEAWVGVCGWEALEVVVAWLVRRVLRALVAASCSSLDGAGVGVWFGG